MNSNMSAQHTPGRCCYGGSVEDCGIPCWQHKEEKGALWEVKRECEAEWITPSAHPFHVARRVPFANTLATETLCDKKGRIRRFATEQAARAAIAKTTGSAL